MVSVTGADDGGVVRDGFSLTCDTGLLSDSRMEIRGGADEGEGDLIRLSGGIVRVKTQSGCRLTRSFHLRHSQTPLGLSASVV